MYCVIQEIERKKTAWKGEYKELKVSETRWFSNGEENVVYGYTYAGERFERPIKKAYKISIHESYRENGEVKKKQWVIGTMDYYYIATFGGYIGDCCNLEERADTIGITVDELYDIVAVKMDPLRERINKEYENTEEYKTYKNHRKIIDKYNKSKRDFEEIYGNNTYDYYYDLFGVLREKEKFEALKRQREAKREYQRSYYENFKSTYDNFNFGSYLDNKQSNYTDKEKEYLKKIYRAAAKKLHPDVIKDDGGGMKFLNDLKEKWGI